MLVFWLLTLGSRAEYRVVRRGTQVLLKGPEQEIAGCKARTGENGAVPADCGDGYFKRYVGI
jgi:hypothetical protein